MDSFLWENQFREVKLAAYVDYSINSNKSVKTGINEEDSQEARNRSPHNISNILNVSSA